MSNPRRTCKPNLTCHTKTYCVQFKAFMRHVSMKNMVLDVIKVTQDRYNFKFMGYKIMDNHFHFLIQTVEDGESIARIMQYFKARIAERYNKAANRIGTLKSWEQPLPKEEKSFFSMKRHIVRDTRFSSKSVNFLSPKKKSNGPEQQ